ncbi:hypothetical protein BH11BAC2_BH11BAC2_24370 [soil metagenome]
MGTWGFGNLENDGALDWLQDFSDEPNNIKFNSAFLLIMDNDEYIEATDCEEALAAAEVIAAIEGNACAGFPEEDLELILKAEMQLNPDHKKMALLAIEKIASHSELKELWEESEDGMKWYESLKDLQHRLKSKS